MTMLRDGIYDGIDYIVFRKWYVNQWGNCDVRVRPCTKGWKTA